MKVRIGNDIRLQVQLAYGDKQDRVNIQSLKAVFVNKTLKEKFEKDLKRVNRFMHRFPIEPFTNEFKSTACNINSCGYPRYKAIIPNHYNGFGVNPKWNEIGPVKEMPITEYTSAVEYTINPDIVVATFPADAQLYEGVYDLVVVAKLIDPGYTNNVRTVTVDYNNVFELVDNSQGSDVDQPVQIEIDNYTSDSPRWDYYVVSGSYSDNEIRLRRNDNATVHVDISPVSGWYEGD